MKKILVATSMLITLPIYALCPLDPSGNGSCTENVIPQVSPIYENNSGINMQSMDMQPLNSQNLLDSMRSPNNRLNDNLSCPFGICAQGIQSPYGNLP